MHNEHLLWWILTHYKYSYKYSYCISQVNVCDNHIGKETNRHLFGSPQCLGYHFEHGQVTQEMCFPPRDLVKKQVRRRVKKMKAKVVFVAADADPMIAELTKMLEPYKASISLDCFLLVHLIGFPMSTQCAHSGETRTRANRKVTLALSWWHHAPRASPKWPVPQAGHWGLTRLSPWDDAKAIWTYLGQSGVNPGKLIERTPCFMFGIYSQRSY